MRVPSDAAPSQTRTTAGEGAARWRIVRGIRLWAASDGRTGGRALRAARTHRLKRGAEGRWCLGMSGHSGKARWKHLKDACQTLKPRSWDARAAPNMTARFIWCCSIGWGLLSR